MSTNQDLSDQIEVALNPEIATIVQLNHSKTIFRLTGTNVARLLMKGVAINIDEYAFPIGTLFQSAIQDIGVIALRQDSDCFDLLVYRSNAASFRHWLNDSALEFF